MRGTPEAGAEWRPYAILERYARLLREREPRGLEREEAEEVVREAREMGREYERDEDVETARSREYVVIEDPLAYYIPYHSSVSRLREWGIYFRIRRMEDDFINFYSTWGGVLGVSAESAWHVYVFTVFWHELAHHVMEDVATTLERLRVGKYPLVSSTAEERFCEYTAFTTAEKRLAAPVQLPLTWLKRGHLNLGMMNVKRILSCLYYHWRRDDPNSYYRPVVEPSILKAVDGLWRAFWSAHLSGSGAFEPKGEVYRRVFVTTL